MSMVHSHLSQSRHSGVTVISTGQTWGTGTQAQNDAAQTKYSFQPNWAILFLCFVSGTQQQAGGCAHDVYWRKRYLITTNTFKTFWPPVLLPSVRVQRERPLRWAILRDFAINQAPFACQRERKCIRMERDLVAKDGKNMLAGRLWMVWGSLRNGGKENYFQKTSWREGATFFWCNVLCALGIIMQISANTNTEVRML